MTNKTEQELKIEAIVKFAFLEGLIFDGLNIKGKIRELIAFGNSLFTAEEVALEDLDLEELDRRREGK